MRKKIPLIKRYKKPLPKYGAGGTQLAIGAADMGANVIESTNESDDYGRVNATKSVATGTLKGAAAGAAMGSVIPVWGTAVGAVVGGAVGGITSGLKAKKTNEAADEAENANNLMQSQQLSFEQKMLKDQELQDNINLNSSGMYAKFGGKMPQYAMGGQPNAEVEGGGYGENGENTLTPDGSTTQYNGPTHEQGGIPTQLQPGEMVFSDRIKIPGTKKTIAEANEINNTNKEDKILNNKESDSYATNSAELMKMAKNKKSLQLYNLQEDIKEAKLVNYAKKLGIDLGNFNANQASQEDTMVAAYGGKLPKYDVGGKGKNPSNQFNLDPASLDPNNISEERSYQYYGGNEIDENLADSRQLYDYYNKPKLKGLPTPQFDSPNSKQPLNLNQNLATQNLGQQINTTPNSNFKYNLDIPKGGPVEPKEPTDYSEIGKGLLQNVGPISTLLMSTKLDKDKYDRVTAKTVDPKLLDPSQALRDMRRSYVGMKDTINQKSNGNSSTVLNNTQASYAAKMRQEANTRKDYDNANSQISNAAKYANQNAENRASEVNAGIQREEFVANQMNKAQRRNNISDSIKNIGENLNSQIRDIKGDKMDQETLKLIATRYPEMMNDPELAKYFKNGKAKTKETKKK